MMPLPKYTSSDLRASCQDSREANSSSATSCQPRLQANRQIDTEVRPVLEATVQSVVTVNPLMESIYSEPLSIDFKTTTTSTTPLLPPELLDLIFTFTVAHLTPAQRDATLSRLSLVCSNWTDVARRGLFESLTIRDGYHLRTVTYGMKESSAKWLWGVTKSLKLGIGGRTGGIKSRQESGGMGSGAEEKLDHEDLLQLARVSSKVTHLELHRSLLEGIETSPNLPLDSILFPHLTSLCFTSSTIDLTQALLRTILKLSPTLTHLSLISFHRGPWSVPEPLTYVPPGLKSLTIQGTYYEYLVFPPSHQFLPLTVYFGLQHLDIEGKISPTGLATALEVAGPTLLSLRLRTSLPCSLLISSFPHLKVLQSLQTPTLFSIPQDFFSHLPTTLTSLKTQVTRASLVHLYRHPRLLLRLEELYLPDNDIPLLAVLPSTIKKVAYRQGWATLVLEFLQRGSYPTSLEEIGLPNYRALEDVDYGIRFKAFGIRLVVGLF